MKELISVAQVGKKSWSAFDLSNAETGRNGR